MHHKAHKDLNHTRVHQVRIEELTDVTSLVEQWKNSGVFAGGQLASAIDILLDAKDNDSNFFVGLAGAMIPGGMRKVIADAIRDGNINVLVTTGANITHDLIEAFGGIHLKNVVYSSDIELKEKGIDRVYDSFVGPGSFELFEDEIKKMLNELMETSSNQQLIVSPSELLRFIGERIDDNDSIVRAAYENKVPIFVPAITDSVLGLQIWLFSQFNRIIIDTMSDLGKIQEIYAESPTNCAVLFGGGVPKNYTLQSALMASKHYQYAVQITLDRVETGGLSGASLEEAISWGKLEADARMQTVVCDLTIALPVVYKILRDHQKN